MSSSFVPSGSPSRGGDVVVYVLDTNKLSLPTPFILFLCLFLSLWSFQLYFIPKILPATLHYLTLFFLSYFCFTGPFNNIYLFVSVFKVFSTVFHSINSPGNAPLSHSVLPVLSLPYWSFQLYISL